MPKCLQIALSQPCRGGANVACLCQICEQHMKKSLHAENIRASGDRGPVYETGWGAARGIRAGVAAVGRSPPCKIGQTLGGDTRQLKTLAIALDNSVTVRRC